MAAIEQIKQLRQETQVSISECKKALEEAGGDIEKAKEILRKRGKKIAEKKKEREVREGLIETYVHPNKKIGVMLELACESDFVAKSKEFQKLAHELCLQIAAMDPDKDSLLSQLWIKDETQTIKDLITDHIARLGENIEVKKFIRYQI